MTGKIIFESSSIIRANCELLYEDPQWFFYDKDFIENIIKYTINYVENNKCSRKELRRLICFLLDNTYINDDSNVYKSIINKHQKFNEQVIQFMLRTEDLLEFFNLCHRDDKKGLFYLMQNQEIATRLDYLRAREMLKDIAIT